jgi:hypothetical protein
MNYHSRYSLSITDKVHVASLAAAFSLLGIFIYFCSSSLAKQEKPLIGIAPDRFEFRDVVEESELRESVDSSAAQWADYDADGLLDVAVCFENGAPRLYQNQGHGKFLDSSKVAGIHCDEKIHGKACFWFDYNNDQLQDLFFSYSDGSACFFHNNGDGTFANVTADLANSLLAHIGDSEPEVSKGL